MEEQVWHLVGVRRDNKSEISEKTFTYLSLKRLEKADLLSVCCISFLQCFASVLIFLSLILADASTSRHICTSSALSPWRLAWHCLMLVTDSILPPSFTWSQIFQHNLHVLLRNDWHNFAVFQVHCCYCGSPWWCSGSQSHQWVCKTVVWFLRCRFWEVFSPLCEILCAALEHWTLCSWFQNNN